jgi:hypothetical protein
MLKFLNRYVLLRLKIILQTQLGQSTLKFASITSNLNSYRNKQETLSNINICLKEILVEKKILHYLELIYKASGMRKSKHNFSSHTLWNFRFRWNSTRLHFADFIFKTERIWNNNKKMREMQHNHNINA